MRNSGGGGRETGRPSVHDLITKGKGEGVGGRGGPRRGSVEPGAAPFGKLRAGSSASSGQALRRLGVERGRRQRGDLDAGLPGYSYGQPGRGGGGQVFSVCRRCVQFPRQCVQFSPECVHFSGSCVQPAPECVQLGFTTPPSRQPQRGGFWSVLRWRLDGVSARRRSTMALASGDDARARGVHRVRGDVFSFRPNVFTFRANVFSFRPDVFTLQADVFSRGWRCLRPGGPSAEVPGRFGVEIRRPQRAGGRGLLACRSWRHSERVACPLRQEIKQHESG